MQKQNYPCLSFQHSVFPGHLEEGTVLSGHSEYMNMPVTVTTSQMIFLVHQAFVGSEQKNESRQLCFNPAPRTRAITARTHHWQAVFGPMFKPFREIAS